MQTATYTKLTNGTWGIRVAGKVAVGATISVTKRDGSSKSAVVASVIWTGIAKDGREASLCAIAEGRSADRSNVGSVWDPDQFRGYGARKGGYTRTCKTGGNCSSFGSGKECGAPDCDGY